ncbi:hypothetical protein BT69DRAFT_1333518 [Atractiella rhizophila]|nr:hypothetical protein BT69DRAFT_1333518 [Atractiella rhizophila]
MIRLGGYVSSRYKTRYLDFILGSILFTRTVFDTLFFDPSTISAVQVIMLTKSFFSISLLVAGAFASPAPVQKRQYEADLKAGIVGIGEKWNEIAKLVDNTKRVD